MSRARVLAPPAAGFDELLAFVAAHAASDVDLPLARFILSRRVRDHGAIFDVHDGAGRIALAALVERADGSELILLAARPERLHRRAVAALLARAEERGRGAGGVDLPLLPDRAAWQPLLVARGWREAYALHTMARDANLPSLRRRRLPAGWRWTPLGATRLGEHRALLVAAFGALPGAYIPSLEELRESARGTSILVGDGKERAFASVRRDERTGVGYINAVGRDPQLRGHGLGDHALWRALALLRARRTSSPAGRRPPPLRVELEVVAGNRAALQLYRRHGFAIVRTTPVLRSAVVA